mmetsp:Transcript_51956/g.119519  ORF Transcript_51956/g.119519 Transcript_51956/m.119519 type:complete len:269 (+) Transcript_51956:1032-1838(+)
MLLPRQSTCVGYVRAKSSSIWSATFAGSEPCTLARALSSMYFCVRAGDSSTPVSASHATPRTGSGIPLCTRLASCLRLSCGCCFCTLGQSCLPFSSPIISTHFRVRLFSTSRALRTTRLSGGGLSLGRSLSTKPQRLHGGAPAFHSALPTAGCGSTLLWELLAAVAAALSEAANAAGTGTCTGACGAVAAKAHLGSCTLVPLQQGLEVSGLLLASEVAVLPGVRHALALVLDAALTASSDVLPGGQPVGSGAGSCVAGSLTAVLDVIV